SLHSRGCVRPGPGGAAPPVPEEWVDGARVAHRQWSADAVELVSTAFVVLRCDEERQDVVIRPAECSEARPFVVVATVAPHVQHGVHRARAADDSSAWQVLAV